MDAHCPAPGSADGPQPWQRRWRSASPLAWATWEAVLEAERSLTQPLRLRAAPRTTDRQEPGVAGPIMETVATEARPQASARSSRESMPSRCLSGTGTPMTGSSVTAASMPGRCAAPPAPRHDPQAPTRGAPAVIISSGIRWGGDHVGLVEDLELVQDVGGSAHGGPVGVRAHHNADQGAALVMSYSFGSCRTATVRRDPGREQVRRAPCQRLRVSPPSQDLPRGRPPPRGPGQGLVNVSGTGTGQVILTCPACGRGRVLP